MTNSALQLDLQSMMSRSPFVCFWSLTISALDPEAQRLSMRMPWRTEGDRGAGTQSWHGGPIASLIDTAGCFAAIMATGRSASTIGLNVDYLRPASGALEATAVVRKAGRTISTVEVDVVDQTGRVAAVGRGTFVLESN
jgi:uncharacterized protein (TIGR00369 family)